MKPAVKKIISTTGFLVFVFTFCLMTIPSAFAQYDGLLSPKAGGDYSATPTDVYSAVNQNAGEKKHWREARMDRYNEKIAAKRAENNAYYTAQHRQQGQEIASTQKNWLRAQQIATEARMQREIERALTSGQGGGIAPVSLIQGTAPEDTRDYVPYQNYQ